MVARLLFVLLVCVSGFSCLKSSNRVVVYCAQDPEFAEALFNDFPKESGLSVSPKFDTEANKSVSLAAELLAEKSQPRADVHWNNEIINTIRLSRAGVYESTSWHSFAARARVLIVNTKLVPEADQPKSLLDLTLAKWKGRIAMAKPQFGTTATQAAALFEVLGQEAAKAYYHGLKLNDVQLVAGNKQVAKGVSEGKFAIGMTDTDDAMVEILAGQPVVMLFPDANGHPQHPRLGTILIPNTLAIVKGAPNPTAAKKLFDYLARPETELRLAKGGAFQIPLNKTIDAREALPKAMHPAIDAKAAAIDWEKATDLWDEVQAYLRDEFAR